MKKIICYLLVFVLLLVGGVNKVAAKKESVEKTDDYKATLYLFRLSGCPHCADEMDHLLLIQDQYKDRLDIVVYDVSDKKTMKLAKLVAKELGSKYKGAPYNVIGKKQYVGYSETFVDDFDEFLEAGIEAKGKDVVSELLKKDKYKNVKSTTLEEAIELENKYEEEEKKKSSNSNNKQDKVIIIMFVGAVLASILGFVISTKRYDK
ncbi:MAG: thioredoxin family protein [Bacilli bacterium]|nr:thioredoxin family protein [Bacilli bacterium]